MFLQHITLLTFVMKFQHLVAPEISVALTDPSTCQHQKEQEKGSIFVEYWTKLHTKAEDIL